MNGFLTLTYDDEHVPRACLLSTREETFILRKRDIQLFNKRLRAKYPTASLRFFSVGEYGHAGTRKWNPHFHLALFGLGCNNKIQRPETGTRCYCPTCSLIRETWGKGNITFDDLNETTAAYIGSYVNKKMTQKTDLRLQGRPPEFALPPRRPGLAAGAVPQIADALKSEYGHLAFANGDVPHTLSRGKTSVPLGRFLKQKIRQSLNLEKVNLETGEIGYGPPTETLEKLKLKENPELYALQNDPNRLTQAPDYDKIDKLKEKAVATRKQKIYNLETKHQIFTSGKAKQL